jgi:hypothetical protein
LFFGWYRPCRAEETVQAGSICGARRTRDCLSSVPCWAKQCARSSNGTDSGEWANAAVISSCRSAVLRGHDGPRSAPSRMEARHTPEHCQTIGPSQSRLQICGVILATVSRRSWNKAVLRRYRTSRASGGRKCVFPAVELTRYGSTVRLPRYSRMQATIGARSARVGPATGKVRSFRCSTSRMTATLPNFDQ